MQFHKAAVTFLKFFIVWGLTACGKSNSPEPFYIEASSDTTTTTIGEIIEYQVWARGAQKRQIEFGTWSVDSTMIDVRSIEELEGSFRDEYGLRLKIALWDTGLIELPPFPVHVKPAGEENSFVMNTDPVFITVVSLLQGGASSELRPIKGPVPVPFIWPLKGIALGLLLVGLIIAAVYIWRTRIIVPPKKNMVIVPAEPADVRAFRKINQLSESKPWLAGEYKDYYIELSLLMREYVENSVYIKTLEMTTEEIRANRDLLSFPDDLVDKWLVMLDRSDLIKFARQVPSPEICQADLTAAAEFVKKSIPYWRIHDSSIVTDSKFESPPG